MSEEEMVSGPEFQAPPAAPPPVAATPARAPYGMTPGQRHFLPGITPLLAAPYQSSVKPDTINLDEDTGSPTPQQADATNGWDMIGPDGKHIGTLALDPERAKDYQGFQVQKLGNALISQATNEAEKTAAQRSLAWGLAQVGNGNISDISKDMVHRYDIDTKGSESLELAKMRHPGARGLGPGGPAGPTKADKFQNQLDGELRKSVDGVIESERKGSKYTAISEQENNIAQMDRLLASPNAMGQRVAVQRALLELTGKASRESEQAALTGAAGKWEELKNKLSLWTSDDPQLSRQYIAEFRQMLAVQRQYVAEQKAKIADAAATRAAAEAFGYPEEQRDLAYSIVRGAMTGNFEGPAAYKPKSSAPSAAPAGKVSPHLQQYVK